MLRWTADFLRFWWASIFLNLRKTWFRLTGAHRDACPCQAYSDSGLALDSRCEAVAHWHEPRRFRRVCPLLTETPQGWRCGVDAERVRPFWGRALLHFGVGAVALYLVGTAAVYATLRNTGYQVSYLSVLWPGHWAQLRRSQEQLYASRAQVALQAGDYQTALLALQTVGELNPRNFGAGLALANLLQLSGQPGAADQVYERLMHALPSQRTDTARVRVRALLAQANYEAIKPLAVAMLSEDAGHREAWLHALVFSARQTRDAAALAPLVTGEDGLPEWCREVALAEQQFLQGHRDAAAVRLDRVHARAQSAYLPQYQVDALLRLNRPDEALRVLGAYGDRVPAPEAGVLRLRAFQQKGWPSLADGEVDALMALPMSPRLAVVVSAHLVAQGDRPLAQRFLRRFLETGPTIADETLPLYQAVLLVALLHQQTAEADRLIAQLGPDRAAGARAVHGLAELLRRRGPKPPLGRLLPLLPLPLEVVYALHERPAGSAK